MSASGLSSGLRFLLFGIAGWALENALYGPRYSAVFGGLKVPFLPVYGAGGVVLGFLEPHLQDMTPAARAVSYGFAFTALEVAACKADRALGWTSWDYAGQCVDVPHAVAWGVLGIAAEVSLRRMRGRAYPAITRA